MRVGVYASARTKNSSIDPALVNQIRDRIMSLLAILRDAKDEIVK
jgi:hypothetical protein